MKIGIICYPTHGGSGVVATGIGHAMAERGHDVHIISYAAPFRFRAFTTRLKLHEVEVSAYPLFRYPPYDLALANTILEVAEDEGLDLIHAHYAVPHAISAHLAREMLCEAGKHVRIITTLHGTDVTIVGQERGYRRITRFGIEQSDAVTAVSDNLANESAQLLGVPRERIQVIPNFVDTDRFQPEVNAERRAMLALPGEKIVMHISNFREVKRPLDVIEAFSLIPDSVRARLIMIGDGPLIRACKDRAHALGVGEHVRFIGTVDTPWELLPQADVFLLPSQTESFGLVALEAMSCGVPVVASNAGGLPEVVTPGETGYLCEVGNVAEMGDRLAQLLSDDALRATMGLRCREIALTRFSKEALTQKWEDFYTEVMNINRPCDQASRSS